MKKKMAIFMAALAIPLCMGAAETETPAAETENAEVTNESTEVTNNSTEVTNANTEVPNSNTEVTNANTEVINENTGNLQSEEMMRNYMSQFNGRLIVNIEYEGASDATLPTVKAATMAHVGDEFNADIAMRDREALLRTGYFYEAYQTFTEVPEGVLIIYHTMENPVLRRIEISGNTLYKTEELEELITVRKNTVLNTNTLQDNLEEIEEKYHGDGYILMKITDMNVDKDGVLALKINEGMLEGYGVKGNKKTKDYVILREMRQKVGEPFNAKLARRSMDRVYNLGFFEDVNINMNPGIEPNAIIMEVNVKERRTGTFGVGAGYSTRDGFLGSVTIADTNFRGRGDSISVSFEKSAEESDAHGWTFAFKKPWLDHR